MDERRKRVLLIAAAILAARKLVQNGALNVPATICAISDAVRAQSRSSRKVDRPWPAK